MGESAEAKEGRLLLERESLQRRQHSRMADGGRAGEAVLERDRLHLQECRADQQVLARESVLE